MLFFGFQPLLVPPVIYKCPLSNTTMYPAIYMQSTIPQKILACLPNHFLHLDYLHSVGPGWMLFITVNKKDNVKTWFYLLHSIL